MINIKNFGKKLKKNQFQNYHLEELINNDINQFLMISILFYSCAEKKIQNEIFLIVLN